MGGAAHCVADAPLGSTTVFCTRFDSSDVSLLLVTGSSSARIVVTLVHALRQRGLKRGIASACIGGGEAMAVAVEVC
jgi:hypothetical protein